MGQRRSVDRAIVQIRFAHADGERRPVSATTRRYGTGARVTVEVEPEAIPAGNIWVLYRPDSDVVIAGSARRERVEAALASLSKAYRIAQIPVDDRPAA